MPSKSHQLALFIDQSPEQDIYAQRARDTRADDLLSHVDKLARVPDVPLSLLDDLRALAELRRHEADWDRMLIANAVIWPDYLAWLDSRITAIPDGNLKTSARNAWVQAQRRVRHTFPEWWFYQVSQLFA